MMITANSTTHVAARREMPQREKERFHFSLFTAFQPLIFCCHSMLLCELSMGVCHLKVLREFSVVFNQNETKTRV